MGDKSGVALALQYQGLMARWDGDLSQARIYYQKGLKLAQETGPIWISANYLLWIADLAVEENQYARAVTLSIAAKIHLDNVDSFWDAYEMSTFERIMAQSRAPLEEKNFLTAETEGKSMTLEEAIQYALL